MINFWPLFNEPVGALMVKVPAACVLVCATMSEVLMLGVMLVASATATTLGCKRLAGYVTNTSLVPADNVTTEPAFEEAKITSRDSVVPAEVYVPIPTSHSLPPLVAMV